MSEFRHVSVLAEESIEALAIRPQGIYVDGTLGGGGHSSLIAGRLDGGRLIGIDRDEAAIRAAGERLVIPRPSSAASRGILRRIRCSPRTVRPCLA